jgi:leader peptidase (prepilin peptidase) / N-methyltransferase
VAFVVLGFVGLLLGPLLGVVVDRAVDREPLRAEHRCRVCRASLGPASLVPILHWFRRCGSCGAHPGWRYPVTDLATAASFVLVGARFEVGWPTVAYAALAAVLVVLSVIDLETHLLPNVLTYPAFVVGLVLVLGLSVAFGYTAGIVSALVGALTAFVLLLGFHLVHPAGMGMGDVKLAPTLGLFLGWLYDSPLTAVSLVLYTLFVASLGGALVGLTINTVRRRREEIPFGPALAIGTLLIIAVSPALVPTA